jgi:hypothetical protein
MYVMDSTDYNSDVHDTAVTARVRGSAEYIKYGKMPKRINKWTASLTPMERFHHATHMSDQSIKLGVLNESIIGTGLSKDEVSRPMLRPCILCQKGEGQMMPIYSNEIKFWENSVSPLSHLFADIKGPFKVRSQEHYVYGHLITVRPSRFMFVYGMKLKSEAVTQIESCISTCRQLATNAGLDPNHVAITLNTDDDKIYTSQSIQNVYKRLHVKHSPSVPYKKQMNGVVERDTKTVYGRANTFMLIYNAPLKFWFEAVKYAVHVRNITPRKSLDNKTPYEIVYGHIPDVSMCEPFYAPGILFLTTEERSKQLREERALECRFLGIVDNNRYRIYVPKWQRIVERRDCLFEYNHQRFGTNISKEEIDEILRQYPQLLEEESNTPSPPITNILDDLPTTGMVDDDIFVPRILDRPDFFRDVIPYDVDPNEVQQESKEVDEIEDNGNPYSKKDSASDIDDDSDIDNNNKSIQRLRDTESSLSMDHYIKSSTSPHNKMIPVNDFYYNSVSTYSIPNIDRDTDRGGVRHRKFSRKYSFISNTANGFNSKKKHRRCYHHADMESALAKDKFPLLTYMISIPTYRQTCYNPMDMNFIYKAVNITLGHIPKSFEEALHSEDSKDWIEAYEKEISQLEARQVWTYDLSQQELEMIIGGKVNIIDMKIVCAKKLSPTGDIIFKIRLTARGFKQIRFIDYDQTYSPVFSSKDFMRALIFIIISTWNFIIELIDFIQAFAQSQLDKNLYAVLPKIMWSSPDKPIYVRLLNALYGLKQASLVWYIKIYELLIKNLHYKRMECDPCIFILIDETSNSIKSIIALFVDDMLIAAENKNTLLEIIDTLRSFLPEMKHYPNFNKYLGLDIQIDNRRILVNQAQYIEDLYYRYISSINLSNNKIQNQLYSTPIDPTIKFVPREENEIVDSNNIKHLQQIHGALRYLCDNTRSDISVALGILSNSLTQPNYELNLSLYQRIILYLYNTRFQSMVIGTNTCQFEMFAFSDASFIKDHDSKGRLGVVIYFSPESGAVYTRSVKDTIVSHSSMESEISAIDIACKQILVFRNFLQELSFPLNRPTKLFIDSASGLELCNSFRSNDKTRHINAKLNYIRQEINLKHVELHFIPSEMNVADILTKPLPCQLFSKFCDWMLNGIPIEDYLKIDKHVNRKIHNNFDLDMGDITIDMF